MKQQYIIVIILFTIIFIWFFMYYFKKEKKIELYTNQIKKLLEQNDNLTSTLIENIKKESLIKKLKNELKIYSQKINLENQNQSKQITRIARQARKLGLVLNSCLVENKKNKKWFSKQNVTYNISGQLEKIKMFIEKIQKKGINLKCKKLTYFKMQENFAQLEFVLQFLEFKKNIQT